MKILALDAHISIIADVQNIFEQLGHNVDISSVSGHRWVTGGSGEKIKGLRKPGRISSSLGRDWPSIDSNMCDKFYKLNKERFRDYDAFALSYPPAFALLFEKFEKPIITISCTRFDYPCIATARLEWLMHGLTRIHNQGQLIPIANNLLDQALAQKYLPFGWHHIPSLCDYMSGDYEGTLPTSALWYRGSIAFENSLRSLSSIDSDFTIRNRYDRGEVKQFKSVVHMPYQVSIMSAFEHYAQGIPMLVPSLDYVQELLSSGAPVMEEVLFHGSSLELPKHWLSLSDYYDASNFNHLVYFDSIDDLQSKLATSPFLDISSSMKEHHKTRQKQVLDAWVSVLEGMK